MGQAGQHKQEAGDARRGSPGSYTLVHHVGGVKKVLFPPQRLMNTVTYLGRMKGNDIVLASDNVSRRHAKLIVTDMGVTVHDLDSHNGVFLNGKKVRSTPVTAGDLLYVGDVCIELRRNEEDPTDFINAGATRSSHSEITGEEDPAVRSLATLLRASDLCATAGEDSYAVETVELCRELTEANIAVLVTAAGPGDFETPVVLQPENGKRGEVAISWGVVKKVFEDGLALFTNDARKRPLVAEEKSEGAIMCVPVVVDGHSEAAIYLSRPVAGPVFTERELETVAAITQLMSARRRVSASSAAGASATSSASESAAPSLAAQAKIEAAEQKLRDAQADARALTERIHALEADNLKLKQNVEVEKANAIDAKRDAERARTEAQKLDVGLHKTDEEAKKLKDAIHRLEEERAKLRENLKSLDEERKAKGSDVERLKESTRGLEAERQRLENELETLRRQSTDAASEIVRLTEEMRRGNEDAEKTRTALETEMSVLASQREALRHAMRSTLPPSIAEHVEQSLEGGSLVTEAAARPVAALHMELHDLDVWAQKASPGDIKGRLDRFCNAISLRAKANGGRIEQVLGHAHLVTFPNDANSVRAALRCGLEVSALLKDVGVVVGLHVGNEVSGFFGEGESATRVEVGEAPGMARALAQLAHAPTFYATDSVSKIVGQDPAFRLTMVGPARTHLGNTMLFSVETAEGEGG